MDKTLSALEVAARRVCSALTMACALSVVCPACGSAEPRSAAIAPGVVEPPPAVPTIDGFSRPELCSRQRSDVVRDAFCLGEVPRIQGITELEARLGLRLQE